MFKMEVKDFVEQEMQIISFADLRRKSVEIVGSDVTLVPSPGLHELGSSKVKLKKVVDSNWEKRCIPGQQLTVHMSRKYVAYVIGHKGNWCVRVVNLITSDRLLLKELQGYVQDVAFAHIPNELILASIDDFGNLTVHAIETGKSLTCTLLLCMKHHEGGIASDIFYRVVWCPFIPDEDESSSESPYEDVAKLLAVICGSRAELYNMSVVLEYHGKGPFYPEEIRDGFVTIQEHTEQIVDAAFSPDGAALATVSLDGTIKFFPVRMDSVEKPMCIHEWKPHNGKPVNTLFFLDNLQSFSPDVQFWKFAITGAENNTELKLWSCKSWTCLQTLRFVSGDSNREIVMRAGIDIMAGYLILSDINNRLLYVLQIYKDNDGFTLVRSVTEFCMPSPVLSFGILEAQLRLIWGTSCEALCADSEEEDFDESTEAIVISVLMIFPHTMQRGTIAFRPPSSTTIPSNHRSESFGIRGSLSPPPSFVEKPDSDLAYENGRSHSSNINLMTPDAFTASAKTNSHGDTMTFLETGASEGLAAKSLSETSTVIISPLDSSGESVQLSSPRQIENTPLNAFVPIEAATSGIVLSNEEQGECLLTGKNEAGVIQPEATLPGSGTSSVKATLDELLKSDSRLQSPDKFVPSYLKTVSHVSSQTGENDSPGKMQAFKQTFSRVEERFASIEDIQRQQVSSFEDFERRHLSSFADLSSQLQGQIQGIQADLRELKATTKQSEEQASAAVTLEPSFLAQLERMLAYQSSQLQATMEIKFNDLAHMIEDRQNKHHEVSLQSISQLLGNTVAYSINNIVKKEFQENLTPAIVGSVVPLTRQIHNDVIQKLSATDDLLKEGMSKLVQSKSVLEVYRSSLTAVLEPLVKACFKESFQTVLLPSLQNCFGNMFQQLNDVFGKGTKEYMQVVDNHYSKYHWQQEKSQEVLKEIHDLADVWRNGADVFAQNLCQELQDQMQGQLEIIERSVNKTVEEAVRDHITKGFHAQKSVIEDSVVAAVRSRTMTPNPVVDTQLLQAQLMQLVAQGQINSAFLQALQSPDLSVVIYLCHKINPSDIFNQSPCPLHQNVLLGLVQQLSGDLLTQTELKLRYIEESVMNFDMSNAVTRQHAPAVLKCLQENLSKFIQSNPDNRFTRKIKMLSMAVKSLEVASGSE